MSIDALRSTLALERSGDLRAKHKAVLISLADHCNAAGETFLCSAQICDETWYDRKAVLSALADLRDAGLIEDTGKRRGRTGQVIVWRMPFVEHRNQESRKRDAYREHDPQTDSSGPESEQPRGLRAEGQGAEQSRNGNGPGSGMVSERVPKTDSKGPALDAKGSRKRDTEPSTRLTLYEVNPLAEGGGRASAPTPARVNGQTPKPKPAGGGRKKKTARGKREIPEDFEPSAEDLEWAARNCPLIRGEQVRTETLRFVTHHRKEGNRFKRHDQAWRNWMLKAQDFAARDRHTRGDDRPRRELD